jgi:hypothetical protein
VALAAIAAVAWWLLAGGAGAPPQRTPQASETAAPPAVPTAIAEQANITSDVPAAPPTVRRATADALPWVVRGSALRGSRQPFPHARLQATLFAGYEAQGEPLLREIVVADGEGRFAWPLRAPEQTVTIVVDVPGPSGGLRVSAAQALVVAGRPPPQKLAVRLYPLDAKIAGQVTDAGGAPLASAKIVIRSWYRSGATGCTTDGRYEIAVPSVEVPLTLLVAAPGHALERRSLRPPATGATAREDFVLQAGLRIAGRVSTKPARRSRGRPCSRTPHPYSNQRAAMPEAAS